MADFRSNNTFKAIAVAGVATLVGFGGYMIWRAYSSEEKRTYALEEKTIPAKVALKSILRKPGAERAASGAGVRFQDTVTFKGADGKESYAALEPVHGLKIAELEAYQRVNRQYQARLGTSLTDMESACVAVVVMYGLDRTGFHPRRLPEEVRGLLDDSPKLDFLVPEHKALLIEAKHVPMSVRPEPKVHFSTACAANDARAAKANVAEGITARLDSAHRLR